MTSNSVSLVIKNSKRTDAGQYRLQLRNQSGFDTATLHVRVLDRPLPPEHLYADELNGDSLTLFWHPPSDNGGAPVTNYLVEKKELISSTWQKVTIFYLFQCYDIFKIYVYITYIDF